MNCQEITKFIIKIADNLDIIDQPKDRITESLALTKEIQEMAEKCDPYSREIARRVALSQRLDATYISSFSEGLARAEKDGSWFLIDETGDLISSKTSDHIAEYRDDIPLAKRNGDFVHINRNGEQAFSEVFESASRFNDGMARVIIEQEKGKSWNPEGKWHFIDTFGKHYFEGDYDWVDEFGDGLAPVRKNKKWSYIDKAGHSMFNGKTFDQANRFSDGIARVLNNNRWFYIDTSGSPISSETFDNAYTFSDGIARVKNNGESFHIDKSCKPIYDERFDEIKDFFLGLAPVKKDGRWFYVNKSGQLVFQDTYDDAQEFYDGVAAVKKGGKEFYIDCKGRRVKFGAKNK